MKILIVDSTTEGQARYADRINALKFSELESYDITVMLAGVFDYREKLTDADILIIGSGLQEDANNIASEVRDLFPWVETIIFMTGQAYSAGTFRIAHSVGVRKVMSDLAPPLDLLQELVAVRVEHCRQGRTQEAKVIVVTSAKGGAGVTSLVSGLGEVCSEYERKVLLWDLDVSTRDLCRGLLVPYEPSERVSAWLSDDRELTRSSLREAVVKLSDYADILVPPAGMASSLDLVCHTDGVNLAERIIELARVMYDVILVDVGGITGPAAGALMCSADRILLTVGDTSLGVSAVDAYLNHIDRVVAKSRRLSFVCMRTELSQEDIQGELDPNLQFGREAWNLPVIQSDREAARWAGSGRSFFGLANRDTGVALQRIAHELGLVDASETLSHEARRPKRFGLSRIESILHRVKVRRAERRGDWRTEFPGDVSGFSGIKDFTNNTDQTNYGENGSAGDVTLKSHAGIRGKRLALPESSGEDKGGEAVTPLRKAAN